MNATQLAALLTERGLSVRLGDGGQPLLSGPAAEKTPVLIRVVKLLRGPLLAHLGLTPRRRLFLFPTGNVYDDAHWPHDDRCPTTVGWWRYEDDPDWHAVPGCLVPMPEIRICMTASSPPSPPVQPGPVIGSPVARPTTTDRQAFLFPSEEERATY